MVKNIEVMPLTHLTESNILCELNLSRDRDWLLVWWINSKDDGSKKWPDCNWVP